MRRSFFLLLAAGLVLGGRADDEATRIRYLKRAMQLLHDQCEGKAPLTPYSDMRLPCAGRDLVDGALGKLLVSDGADTEGCMSWLRKPGAGSPSSFGGQPWPAIWYTLQPLGLDVKIILICTTLYISLVISPHKNIQGGAILTLTSTPRYTFGERFNESSRAWLFQPRASLSLSADVHPHVLNSSYDCM
jgi:hypothetical protein